jgi:hypothetical protein
VKKKLALSAAAVAVYALVAGSVATSAAADPTSPAAPGSASAAAVPTGAYKIADDLLKADSTLRGPRLNNRYNLWVVGLHGRATVRDKGPTFIDYTWQRGSITQVGTSWVRIKSVDGLVRTWLIAPGTRIRRHGHRVDLTKLVVGDRVFTIGVPGKANGPVASPTATPTASPTPPPAVGGELPEKVHPTAAAVIVPRNKSVAG